MLGSFPIPRLIPWTSLLFFPLEWWFVDDIQRTKIGFLTLELITGCRAKKNINFVNVLDFHTQHNLVEIKICSKKYDYLYGVWILRLKDRSCKKLILRKFTHSFSPGDNLFGLMTFCILQLCWMPGKVEARRSMARWVLWVSQYFERTVRTYKANKCFQDKGKNSGKKRHFEPEGKQIILADCFDSK